MLKFLYKYDWFFNNKNFIVFYAINLSDIAVIKSMYLYCSYNQLSIFTLNGNSNFWYRFPFVHFVASTTSDIFVVAFNFLEEYESWMEVFSYADCIAICFYQNFIYFSNLNLNYNFFDLYIYFFFMVNRIVWIFLNFINNILLKITNLCTYN